MPIEAERAKSFLRTFVDGKKLDKVAIRELYLSGYLGIELPAIGREPIPTSITEKGKMMLEGQKLHRKLFVLSAR
jgi:hypothetical protein